MSLEEAVTVVAKAISPWAFKMDNFIDKDGRYWVKRHEFCIENAKAKAKRAIAAYEEIKK